MLRRLIGGIFLWVVLVGLVRAQGEAPDNEGDQPESAQPEAESEVVPDPEAEPEIIPEGGVPIDPVDPVEEVAPPPVGLEEALALPPEAEPGTTVYFNDYLVPEGTPDLFEDLSSDGEGGAGSSGLLSTDQEFFYDGIASNELLPGGFDTVLNRQGWRVGLGVQALYDSNVFLDSRNEREDLKLTASPTFEYRSAPDGVPGLVTARYTPHFRYYVDNDELSTIDHSLLTTLSYTGSRGSMGAEVNAGRYSRTDRFVGGLSESTRINGDLFFEQQMGSRSILRGSVMGSYVEDEARGASSAILGDPETERLTGQVSGLWQATNKTRFGPTIRYTSQASSLSGNHRSVSFLGLVEHSPRDEFDLSLSLGIERVIEASLGRPEETDVTGSFTMDYQMNDRLKLGADLGYASVGRGNRISRNGGGGQRFTGDVDLTYEPNPDWRFQLAATLDSFPSADQANTSVNNTSYSASVIRQLPDGSLGLTGRMGIAEFDSVGPAARGDSDYYSVALKYIRRIGRQGRLNASLLWSENSGSGLDWERIQAAIGVDWDF